MKDMVLSVHINLFIFSLILLTKSLFCQPISDSQHKTNLDINESNLRYFIAKSLSRHPLGILGHIIVEAVDKASVDEPLPDSMSVRDRRYQTSNAIKDQSFLRFGRNSYRNSKRPKDNYDLNDTSFLRFGRSGGSDS